MDHGGLTGLPPAGTIPMRVRLPHMQQVHRVITIG